MCSRVSACRLGAWHSTLSGTTITVCILCSLESGICTQFIAHMNFVARLECIYWHDVFFSQPTEGHGHSNTKPRCMQHACSHSTNCCRWWCGRATAGAGASAASAATINNTSLLLLLLLLLLPLIFVRMN